VIHTDRRTPSALRERIEAKAAPGWYDIKAAADGSKATVRIYDEISLWGVSASTFVDEISALDVANLEVQINSPGGDVFDGLAIYNALRTHPAKVTTRVDGLAASAASLIAQAGDERVMLTSSQMMIHEAWGVAMGPAATMREFADLLDKQNDVLADLYARHGGQSAEHFKGLMSAETWMNADEAVEAGLADRVLDPSDKKSSARASVRGQRFAEHAESVLADVDALADRASEVMALRADKGKDLSPETAELMQRIDDGLAHLRAALEPAPPTPTPFTPLHAVLAIETLEN
jgi:ATP-dependent Clp endopeptidase proteolytic subunit ClpP